MMSSSVSRAWVPTFIYRIPAPGVTIVDIGLLQCLQVVFVFVCFTVFKSDLFTDILHTRFSGAAIKVGEPLWVDDRSALPRRASSVDRLKHQIAGAKIWRVIEMVFVHLGHHLLDKKTTPDGEFLDSSQHLLRPLTLIV